MSSVISCLTSVGHDIRSAPAGQPVPGEPIAPVEHHDHRGQHEMTEEFGEAVLE